MGKGKDCGDQDILCDCYNPKKEKGKGDRNYYLYYDTPDGCDIDKKTLVTSRYGLIAGMVIGTCDVMLYSHAVGLGNILKRYAVHCGPLSLMGAVFSLVANGALLARKKDDRWNYFLGGFACGPILAYYIGSKHGMGAGGLIMGAIGIVKKDVQDMGGRFMPEQVQAFRLMDAWRRDFTLVTDPKDNMIHTCGKENPSKK